MLTCCVLCLCSFSCFFSSRRRHTRCALVTGVQRVLFRSAIGRPVPGHRVAIIDEGGNVLGPGETGNIAVHSPDPVMFLQYWNNTRATREKYIGDRNSVV